MKIRCRQRRGKVAAFPDLFTWASERDRRAPIPSLPARWLMQRHAVYAARAELLASLAGLGVRS